MDNIKKMIAESFDEIADGIKSGSFKKKLRIGLTLYGSEHGTEEMVRAAELAKRKYGDFDIVLIGPKLNCDFELVEAANAKEGHDKMVELLDKGEIDGCVTQHFDFPIGVSTVGRLITPANGRDVIIATTTGTSSTDRVEGMVKNCISGIAVAKALGLENPTVGILNIDGARKVERTLKKLEKSGYHVQFAESLREDGGAVMRGNDMLAGTPDIMITDSLTGNLLIKIFSAYTTGGNYETLGYGYGPGIGEDYNRLINIVSRSSGAPLICEALKYCSICAEKEVLKIAKHEFEEAKKAGLDDILKSTLKAEKQASDDKENIEIPPKTVVTYAIPGIDILELEDACSALWKENIYCESGMGCTGPVILVEDSKANDAVGILESKGYK